MALLSSYFSDSNHVSNEIHDPKSMHHSDLVVSANVLWLHLFLHHSRSTQCARTQI